jgi:hypothetical protein
VVCLKSVIVKPRKMRRPRPPRGCRAIGKKKLKTQMDNCAVCCIIKKHYTSFFDTIQKTSTSARSTSRRYSISIHVRLTSLHQRWQWRQRSFLQAVDVPKLSLINNILNITDAIDTVDEATLERTWMEIECAVLMCFVPMWKFSELCEKKNFIMFLYYTTNCTELSIHLYL